MTRALITGASSGIGEQFALALAARGWDLVLVARGQAGLDLLAARLTAEHGANVATLSADLSDSAGLATVERLLADSSERIDVLINNAGYGSYGTFNAQDIDAEAGQVDLNITAVIRLTHAALGPMTAAKRGTIMNISSTAGAQPMPYSAVYAASKAFVTSFTYAVGQEQAGSGVHVMAVLPGFTRTHFHERAEADANALPGFMWMEPEQVVADALRAMDRRKRICIPGTMNKISATLAEVSPPALSSRLASRISKNL